MIKTKEVCRVCDSSELVEYIDLGFLPLSNNLCETKEEEPERYPLKVNLCKNCGLSQLSVVIDPQVLFGHYVYRSSINKGYVDHCCRMAKELKKTYHLNRDSFHVDIAGNDGALLNEFKKEIGLRVLNIDPAYNLLPHNHKLGVSHWPMFWGEEAAHLILTRYAGASKSEAELITDPRADLITATNVFAHVDDVLGFMTAVKMVLKPSGALILEFPYLIDFIENNEFDTIYFEHLSYFSIIPLDLLCDKVGLNIMRVEKQDIHGGTVRVHIGYEQPDTTVGEFIKNEFEKYQFLEPFYDFRDASMKAISDFKAGVNDLVNTGYKVAGFAASAKGNTLLNCAGITDKELMYIIDETPEKVGKYSPGTHIPILWLNELESNPPDFLVILSWNFAAEITTKCRANGYKGKFIIPIPQFKILD